MSRERIFFDNQDEKIKNAKELFRAAALNLSKSEEAGSSAQEQKNLLKECQTRAREFFRVLNDAVMDSGPLKGDLFKHWKEDRLASALNVLWELPKYQNTIRAHRSRLNDLPDNYEFGPAVFDNMQGIVAWERPDDARKLRDEFDTAKLPSGGFSRPRERVPMSDESDSPPVKSPWSLLSPAGAINAASKAHPAFKYAIVVLGFVGIVAIGGKYGISYATAVFGVIILVVLMVLFLVFAAAASAIHDAKSYSLEGKVLVWSGLILGIVVAVFLLFSAFFDNPLPLKTKIIEELGLKTKVEEKSTIDLKSSSNPAFNPTNATKSSAKPDIGKNSNDASLISNIYPLKDEDKHEFSGSKHSSSQVSLDSQGIIEGTIRLENDTLFSGFDVATSLNLLDSSENVLAMIQLQSVSIGGKSPGKAISKTAHLSGKVVDHKIFEKVRSIKIVTTGG